MKRHTTLKRWLIVLVILFAPPFLVVGAMQALSWLLYRLFPSAPLPLAWLGIEGYAATVLGAHVLLSTGLMWLLVRRWRRPERFQFLLTAVAVPLAMPFLAFWPLSLLARLSHRLFPSASSIPWLFFGIGMYPFLSTSLLSDMTRYVILSLVALILTLAALIWLAAQERGQVWRHEHFYALLTALVAILAFPLLMRYQPVVEAAPGVELRVVDEPGLLEGVVKSCQAAAEVRECQYEPLGWADAQTFVYRQWCGGRYEMGVWHPGGSQPPQAYHLDADEVVSFEGDLTTLTYETCVTSACVLPALAAREPFEQGYHPGQYEDALISPNGRWVAFTAEHIYGPEDLLVMSNE
ncbi:MAG: hypothetical protein SXV54_25560 [Chloroflexota bacterium]|nr:hypothetical protein [Chloroflexota bacterium]